MIPKDLASAKAVTTDTDINEGYALAYEELIKKTGAPLYQKLLVLRLLGAKNGCGGLVEELTVEAAKRACLGLELKLI